MKKLITTLFTTCMLFLSNSAFAEFGEKVNCTTQTSQSTYYYGWASCRVGTQWLDEYVSYHHSPSYYITRYISGQFYSCWANLPSTGTQTNTTEQCDYKPLASYDARATSSLTTRISGGGRDFDGSIVSSQLWVEGVFQPSGSIESFWSEGTVLSIRVKVTDNDGYTHEINQSHMVTYAHLNCPPLSICEGE